jgi:hypothetical protein
LNDKSEFVNWNSMFKKLKFSKSIAPNRNPIRDVPIPIQW